MRPINPDDLNQYIRQVLMQEEHAYTIRENEPVDYAEYRNIVETVAKAAAHWVIAMARDDSDYDGAVAPPLPETPGATVEATGT